jgi:hypothetical protein
MGKSIKNLNQDSQLLSQDLNLGPPKYEAGMLIILMQHLAYTDLGVITLPY